jgi:hypothetical protein
MAETDKSAKGWIAALIDTSLSAAKIIETLYGWDCESTFWYRWAFAEIAHVGPRTFVEREQ